MIRAGPALSKTIFRKLLSGEPMKTSQGLTDNRDQSNESLGQGLFSLDLNLPASCTNQESRTSESLAEQSSQARSNSSTDLIELNEPGAGGGLNTRPHHPDVGCRTSGPLHPRLHGIHNRCSPSSHRGSNTRRGQGPVIFTSRFLKEH